MAFPPANAFVSSMKKIDYKKHYNQFMDAVVIFCAFVAAVYTVSRKKWEQYNVTERLQLFVLFVKEKSIIVSDWLCDDFSPFVVDTYNELRSIYNIMRTV